MQGFEYNVDLVFCIDITGSMSPIINTVKQNALRLHADITKALLESGRHIDKMRIKVIGFRDIYADGGSAFELSRFFDLPTEQSHFEQFVTGLRAHGGGDEPESGLEALAQAISSEWTSGGSKRRHVIVLWTDASAHQLKAAASDQAGSTETQPASFDELTDLWSSQSIELSSKRLILFAPEMYPWPQIAEHWENTIWSPTRAGSGLNDVDYSAIVNAVAHSLGG